MPLDALNYHHLAQELNTTLSGGRIDKITMPLKNGVLLFVRNSGICHKLLISADPQCPRCHITKNDEYLNPSVAPSFLMHLRKHINGGKIKSIKTIDFERVLMIRISTKNELGFKGEKTLIVELMGKYSNIILVDENKKITDAVRRITPDISSKRSIIPSLYYTQPPQQNKIDCSSVEALTAVLEGFEGGKLQGFIQRSVSSLAPVSISEAIFRSFNTFEQSYLSKENAAKLAKNLNQLFFERLCPCALISNEKLVDFFFAPYAHLSGEYKFFESLSDAMDIYFSSKKAQGLFSEKQIKLQTLAKNAYVKAIKRLELLNEKSNECADYETDRVFGELITANIFKIKLGDKYIDVNNYYSPNNEIITIPLDEALSPQKNAQSYFKRYAKKKKTILINIEQIERSRQDAEYFDSVLVSLSLCQSKEDILEIEAELTALGLVKSNDKKLIKNTAPRFSSYEFMGYIILLGKNNIQNDTITRNASPTDLWFHVKDVPSSHVIIKNASKDFPPDEVILFAARLAAQNSKAKGQDKAPVDYTFIKNVTKPKGAPLGKVVYTNQFTVFVNPNE